MNVFLITVSVLAPFGWVIYKLLRYSAQTIGDESPLVIVVTYEIEDWEYFVSFNFFFLLFFTLINLFFLYAAVFFQISAAAVSWHWFIRLCFLASSVYALWWCVLLFRLEWQYWLITKGKTITLDPTDKSLEIATSQETVRLTAADVDEVEKHAPGLNSGKMVAGYQYFIFKLKDGRRVYLNHNKSYLDFAIDDYFKTVPTQRISHKIPWIVAP
ncbi:hypothetical protein GCM10028803_12520 [Larkinella knui]|uniref:PH domain-containing protein n=1 Tax=Larkinella knui TaxID=2025310 RepID=A0A3P1CBU3_9BACT|nr:hypothetical protein [Larkinella knui]RRB10791.1 hypothetical protein EHT87_26955 [Larkinella knui]